MSYMPAINCHNFQFQANYTVIFSVFEISATEKKEVSTMPEHINTLFCEQPCFCLGDVGPCNTFAEISMP